MGLGKTKNSRWELIDDSYHPKFDLWERIFDDGEHYYETFLKGVNPNYIFKSRDGGKNHYDAEKQYNYAKELFRDGYSMLEVDHYIPGISYCNLIAAYNQVEKETNLAPCMVNRNGYIKH